MAKVAPPVLESLARIGYSEKPLADWLKGRLEEYKEKLVLQTDDVQMRIFQGRAQELTDILEMVKNASELLRKA